MKVFLPPHVFKIANNIVTALETIGVEYTSSITESVDAVLYRDETETEIAQYYNIDPTVVTEFGGDLARYVANKNNLPNRSITWKSLLNEALIECNLPVLDTIYPTTKQEIIDFFEKHKGIGVYCKSVLSKSGRPTPSTLTGIGNTDIIFPNNLDYYNQRYDSYDYFTTKLLDIDNFLEIQNSDKSLVLHKCILQEDHGNEVDTFWLSGCVNANNEFYFYPTINTTLEYIKNVGSNLTINMHEKLTMDQIFNTIRDPNNYNVDTIGIHDEIKTLFASRNINSTFFSIQGIFDSEGNKLIRDISLNPVSSHIFANPPEVLADHLKFVLGLQPHVTLKHEDYLMYMPFVLNTSVFTSELIQTIKSAANAIPIMVVDGGQMANFCFIGDSKEKVANNMLMVYDTYIKPYSI